MIKQSTLYSFDNLKSVDITIANVFAKHVVRNWSGQISVKTIYAVLNCFNLELSQLRKNKLQLQMQAK